MTDIVIHEVGPRDGLQMERAVVPLERKLAWVRALAAAGVDIVQAGSFVHPGKVPQLADTDRLFAELRAGPALPPGVVLSALVLNGKGLERAFAAGVDLVCMGVSASETHSRKNTGMSIAGATAAILAMAQQVMAADLRVQVSVQSAFGCGYEGAVPAERVLDLVRRYVDHGITHLSLADTAGHAVPDQVARLFAAVFALGPVEAACHFHDTYGLGMANAWAALQAGVTHVETSVAGLGGCPFTKVAGGNVCTEDFVHLLQKMGLREDVSLEGLVAVAEEVAGFFGREMPGKVYRVGQKREERGERGEGGEGGERENRGERGVEGPVGVGRP